MAVINTVETQKYFVPSLPQSSLGNMVFRSARPLRLDEEYATRKTLRWVQLFREYLINLAVHKLMILVGLHISEPRELANVIARLLYIIFQ